MAVNPSLITTKSISNDPRVVVRMLSVRPVVGAKLDAPVTPNELVGVFNGALEIVELFVSDASGYYYLPIMDSFQ